MHELSLALSILDLATEEMARHGASRVVAIHLRLGPLAGVVAAALQSAFDLARQESPLAGAELVIEAVPLVTWCPACAAECMPASVWLLGCPVCGGPTPQVMRGRELEVTALEVES